MTVARNRLTPDDLAFYEKINGWLVDANQRVAVATAGLQAISDTAGFFWQHIKEKYGLTEEDVLTLDGKIKRAGKTDGQG